MSIQKDLTRIKNAKASIKAAIEGKGVAVPDATLLDGMAALIESIEAGGGGGGLKVEYGTVTVAEDTIALSISHNLGITPKLYMAMNLLSSDTDTVSDLRKTLGFYVMSEYFDIDSFRSNKGLVGYANSSGFFTDWNVYGESYAENSYATATTTYVTIGSDGLNTEYSLRAGSTYFYLIMG